MKNTFVFGVLVAALMTLGSFQEATAQGAMKGMDHGSMGQGGMMGQAAESMADGEVRKVDKRAGKLTIRHGAIPGMDMPSPMTMVYRVKDAAMLDQVKPGDKVRFLADKVGGAFTVMQIEPVQ